MNCPLGNFRNGYSPICDKQKIHFSVPAIKCSPLNNRSLFSLKPQGSFFQLSPAGAVRIGGIQIR